VERPAAGHQAVAPPQRRPPRPGALLAPLASAGFALLGLGLAGVFPQIVTAAARLDPGQAGRNIGRIAAVSYSGLLSGPVVIGAIASGVGLRNALLVPAALAVLVAAAAGVMKPARLAAPVGQNRVFSGSTPRMAS
jgi:MFS family permease